VGGKKERLPSWVSGWSLFDRTIELAGRPHRIEVVGDGAGIHISVRLDDVVVGRVVAPIETRPWEEIALPVEGSQAAVGIWWTMASPKADLFVDGRSVSNRRSIELVRADASRPIRGFDRWFGYWPWLGIDWLPLPPIWSAPIAIGLIALLNVIPLAERGLRLATAIALALGWFWIWAGLVVRATRWLRARRELNSWLRLAAYLGVFGGFPALSLAAFVLVGKLAH
jgi:hypothetical protein